VTYFDKHTVETLRFAQSDKKGLHSIASLEGRPFALLEDTCRPCLGELVLSKAKERICNNPVISSDL
jgi:hypothetical protein